MLILVPKRTILSPHEIAEKIFYLNGRPLDLSQYKLFHPFYDTTCDINLAKTARQVSKSTTLSFVAVLRMIAIDSYRMLYAVPLKSQGQRFSNFYLAQAMTTSPICKKLITSDEVRSVLCKSLKNGSRIEITYVANTSKGIERYRGITTDDLLLDEFQDIDIDQLPIIEQCIPMSSMYKIIRMCGTPKTLENIIEYKWEASCQFEWITKCLACGHQNIPILPDVLKMIGSECMICCKCSKPIDPIKNGQWIAGRPSKIKEFDGRHIPQIVMPFVQNPKDWKKKIYLPFVDRRTYPLCKYVNEVLGLSYDSGGRLITLSELSQKKIPILHRPVDEKTELKTNIQKRTASAMLNIRGLSSYLFRFAGIDWTGSGMDETSKTTLKIGGMKPNMKREYFEYHYWVGQDVLTQADEIAKLMFKNKVDQAGADAGMGQGTNEHLRKVWCPNNPNKLSVFNYLSMNRLIVYDPRSSKYMLNKTMSLNLMYNEIKTTDNITFLFCPAQETDLDYVFDNLLSIYEDSRSGSDSNRKSYKRVAGKSDDFAHSLNFAEIVAKKMAGIDLVQYTGEVLSQNHANAPGQIDLFD